MTHSVILAKAENVTKKLEIHFFDACPNPALVNKNRLLFPELDDNEEGMLDCPEETGVTFLSVFSPNLA